MRPSLYHQFRDKDGSFATEATLGTVGKEDYVWNSTVALTRVLSIFAEGNPSSSFVSILETRNAGFHQLLSAINVWDVSEGKGQELGSNVAGSNPPL